MCLNTNLDKWLNTMNFHSKLHAWFSEMLYANIFCRFQLTLVVCGISVTFDVCNLNCVDATMSSKKSIPHMSVTGRMKKYSRLLTPPMFQAFARVACASVSLLSINILPFTASISSPFTMPPGEKTNMVYIHLSKKNSVGLFCPVFMQ